MRKKASSFSSARAEQLREMERRLELFLANQEFALIGLFSQYFERKEAERQARQVLFESCVKLAQERSVEIRTYLKVAQAEEIYARKASIPRNVVLQCLIASDSRTAA